MPENDPAATFRLDQEAAQNETQTREDVRWNQQVRDAETTLAQREAVTRRVNASAALMEGANVFLWVVLALGLVFVISAAAVALFQGVFA